VGVAVGEATGVVTCEGEHMQYTSRIGHEESLTSTKFAVVVDRPPGAVPGLA
jgi:hypothetical protein